MAAPVHAASDMSEAFLSRVKSAIGAVRDRRLVPFGVEITHILSIEFIEAMQNLSEVSLAADIEGAPDYFDLLAAEEAIGTELGLEVRIIPKRAVWENVRSTFEASLIQL